MSAKSQTLTLVGPSGTSALPPKAQIGRRKHDVGYVP
jgi:hypothetical protein